MHTHPWLCSLLVPSSAIIEVYCNTCSCELQLTWRCGWGVVHVLRPVNIKRTKQTAWKCGKEGEREGWKCVRKWGKAEDKELVNRTQREEVRKRRNREECSEGLSGGKGRRMEDSFSRPVSRRNRLGVENLETGEAWRLASKTKYQRKLQLFIDCVLFLSLACVDTNGLLAPKSVH